MKSLVRFLVIFSALFVLLPDHGYAGLLQCYTLGLHANACSETFDNLTNLTVVSKHQNLLRAEYARGWVAFCLEPLAVK
jgi:hypothetical protein